MFNEGELELFEQLDFGSVFGDKIAGDRMPCLTLCLLLKLEERNENWGQFFDHPWTKLKSDPAYKESCCSSITSFLTALPYSQL